VVAALCAGTGYAGFIGLHLTDRLLADGRVTIGGKLFPGYLYALRLGGSPRAGWTSQ
jgi:nucleoside-diphosphate-sugar epimerase